MLHPITVTTLKKVQEMSLWSEKHQQSLDWKKKRNGDVALLVGFRLFFEDYLVYSQKFL